MIHAQDPAMPQVPTEQLPPTREEPIENPTFCQRVNLFFSNMRWHCCNRNDVVPRGENLSVMPSFSSFSDLSLPSLPSLPSIDADCCDAMGACGEALGEAS